MHQLGIKVKNYKCFAEETGFDEIRRVNLIIGRNNSGKSSLLDVVEIISSGEYYFDETTWRGPQKPKIFFESHISAEAAAQTFPQNTSGGSIGINHFEYGKNYIGRKIKWTHNGARNGANLIECDDKGIEPPLKQSGDYQKRLPNNMRVFLDGKTFSRLLAERDILPEPADPITKIATNGSGLTNAIQSFINKSTLPSELVEQDILDGLNAIFAHDASFTDIVCQLHDDGNWEIYLEEEHKGRIPLSQSGSGLKTVMLVLAYLVLIPAIEETPLGDYIFGFEELENNIYPALLRRLNDYIYKTAIEHDFIYFLTTHSNVLIDQFSKQDDAQIIHITHDGESSVCTTAKTYVENNGILDDLDVRASDILQANGIIWVEGPSDRIYMNRWIDLWSNGEFKEGTHYQIVFYGGRLLSHLSADIPENVEKSISILNANRNAIILIDSDKRNQQASVNATKKRINEEFENLGAFCWITKGKEIENYIPSVAVDSLFELDRSGQVDKYEDFFEHLETLALGEGKKHRNKKPLLAENIVPFMTKENMSTILDLDDCMGKVCDKIRKWNS